MPTLVKNLLKQVCILGCSVAQMVVRWPEFESRLGTPWRFCHGEETQPPPCPSPLARLCNDHSWALASRPKPPASAPTSIISVRYRRSLVPDWVSLFRFPDRVTLSRHRKGSKNCAKADNLVTVQYSIAQKQRVHSSSEGCRVALWGAALLRRVQHSSVGCSIAWQGTA